jgi:potassium efflux system protein
MLIVHAIDFVLMVATGLFMAIMMAWVWDFKWDWIWKLGALPCMPHIKGNIPTVGDVSMSVFILCIAYWLSRNIKTILTRILFEPIKYPPAHQYTTILLMTYLLWTVGVVAALGNLDLSWSKIQWLVAAMGVGVGFGLQEIVSNFISGLILLFERPIKVNDYISLDQLNGVVEEIQIRSTTIRTFNNVSVIVPNKDLITKQIVNQTYNDDVIRLNVPVGVSYGSDVDLVERILLEIASSNKNVLKKPGPTVILKEFGDNAISFLLRAYIDNARCDLTIQSDLNKEIKKRFEDAGITIPFPQRVVHIIGEDGKKQGTKPV